ncbi:MAG: polysaccharide deacetylase family protein [Candidatus Eremiobacteraeota bacterium]|nr:polysaccharide deacetylase family protein [Candidatus Eremiobacteraeota bacterium]
MNLLLAVLLTIPPVVMYHRVDAWSPNDSISQRLTISPTQFADELRDIHRIGLRTIGIDELVRDAQHEASPERAVLLTFDDGYSDQFDYAFPILQRYGDRAVFFINTGTIGTPRHLTWPEVETMAKAGMSIECHGVDHVDLGESNVAEQTYQIDRCVSELRAHLNESVLAFAYPSGDFDAETIGVEREAGVLFGFTTDPRFQTDARSPYQIARIRVVTGMDDAYFAARLEAARAFVSLTPSSVP